MSATTYKSLQRGAGIGARHIVFATAVVASLGLFWRPLSALVGLCLHGDSYSHILLIPFIALYLFWMDRFAIFRGVRWSAVPGLTLILAGIAICWFADPRFYSSSASGNLTAVILGLLVTWLGAFVACYGLRAARSALFPWMFLLLMVPLPEAMLSRIIAALQRGSVDVSLALFKMCGVPVLRQGVLLSVPGVTIEVAKECSSIRSSMALFITCVLAARFYLRSFWKQAFFVVLSLPLSVVKNGIRIAALTLLSLYVNPSFLHGDLHRDGGFAFFVLALVILWPVLGGLHRSETSRSLKDNKIDVRRELISS